MYPVYRRPNNVGVENLLLKARGAGAEDLIAKGSSGAKKMLSILKSNGSLGILMDQKLNEGVAVPFFGKDAMTAPATALFALKFNCPLYPARVERLKGARFKVTIYPALDIEVSGDRDKDVFNILKEMLYVPLKTDEKFKAKAIIDIFAYRSAKAFASPSKTRLPVSNK